MSLKVTNELDETRNSLLLDRRKSRFLAYAPSDSAGLRLLLTYRKPASNDSKAGSLDDADESIACSHELSRTPVDRFPTKPISWDFAKSSFIHSICKMCGLVVVDRTEGGIEGLLSSSLNTSGFTQLDSR